MSTKSKTIRTDTLMRRLFKANDLESALSQNAASMTATPFPDYLAALCKARGMVAERVIRASEIERTYGHQLFNGTRNPSRDKVLQLAFGLGLDVEETQRLLRSAGKSALYPRIKRDAVILYCLNRGMTIMDAQEALERCGLAPLGSVKRYEQ